MVSENFILSTPQPRLTYWQVSNAPEETSITSNGTNLYRMAARVMKYSKQAVATKVLGNCA